MSYVVGIDPSLTATGFGYIYASSGAAHTQVVITRGHRADTLPDVCGRLDTITAQVTWLASECALAVIEGPSHGSRGGSSWDRAGLWWRLVHRLLRLEIPVAVCPPTVRAKWATGKGNAGKGLVSVAMARLWPDMSEQTSDDEWDALALATIGAQQLGWAVPTRAHHADCLAKVSWPDGLAEPAAAGAV